MTPHNLYYRVTKGCKAFFNDTLMQLLRTDFSIEGEVLKAHNRLHAVLSFIESYGNWEAQFILPPIAYYEPGLANQVEERRREQSAEITKIGSLLHDFAFIADTSRQAAAGKDVVAHFEAFSARFILQQAQEEKWVNKLLWRYYSNHELQVIEWKMLAANSSPIRSVAFCKWVVQGLTARETESWLQEVKLIAGEDEINRLQAVVYCEKPTFCLAVLSAPPNAGVLV